MKIVSLSFIEHGCVEDYSLVPSIQSLKLLGDQVSSTSVSFDVYISD